MLFQVYTENGVKKIKYLTADTGTGAPVGSYLMLEKKSNPQGYLYCDGSTFDSSVYPALYQYLGTNVLPDWREFSPVGAEQNTTNVYDASTNPNGTIHDHDVYAEGESKDDQVQDHKHSTNQRNVDVDDAGQAQTAKGSAYNTVNSLQTSEVINARKGTVTRGKRKAVFVYIKATSGLTENQQENVLNTINDNLSYSTTEHKTGKKWIDGKDIWSKVVDVGNLPNSTGKAVVHSIQNLDYSITVKLVAKTAEGVRVDSVYGGTSLSVYMNNINIYITTQYDFSGYSGYAILEYTKTT